MQINLSESIPSAYRRLALVMGLPLVDGVFIALVLTGGLDTLFEAVQVGALVFCGAATISIVLTEFNGDTRSLMKGTAVIGFLISIIAAIEAVFAPTLGSVLTPHVFRRGAVVALLVLAAKILPLSQTDKLPNPGLIVLVSLLLSLDPSGATFKLNPVLSSQVLYAGLSAVIGTVMAVGTVAVRELISGSVNIRYIQYGGATALAAVAFSIVGLVPQIIPAGLLASVTVISLTDI